MRKDSLPNNNVNSYNFLGRWMAHIPKFKFLHTHTHSASHCCQRRHIPGRTLTSIEISAWKYLAAMLLAVLAEGDDDEMRNKTAFHLLITSPATAPAGCEVSAINAMAGEKQPSCHAEWILEFAALDKAWKKYACDLLSRTVLSLWNIPGISEGKRNIWLQFYLLVKELETSKIYCCKHKHVLHTAWKFAVFCREIACHESEWVFNSSDLTVHLGFVGSPGFRTRSKVQVNRILTWGCGGETGQTTGSLGLHFRRFSLFSGSIPSQAELKIKAECPSDKFSVHGTT